MSGMGWDGIQVLGNNMIIQVLGKHSSFSHQAQDSLWTILRYVLREMSTVVCIRLLEHFKFELTRFESEEIDRLCQSVVVCCDCDCNEL